MKVKSDFQRRMPEASQHLRRRESWWLRWHIDLPLLLGLMVTAIFGLIVLYSASSRDWHYVQRQAIFISLGFCVMLGVAQLRLQLLEYWAPWFYCGGMVLLVLVLVIGVGAKGAQRWLSLGGFRFQPSEVLKLAVPTLMAMYLSRVFLPPNFKHVIFSLVLIGLPALLIMKQPDLGTAILIAASGLIALFFAGLQWRYIISAVALLAASIWPMWHFVLHGYQRQRILTMLDPEADKLGAGWNIIQSKTAIGSGGVYGKGWLHGTQSHLDFLPESHTDFIIAVLAEEFGMVGVVFLLMLYLWIIGRGLRIATQAQSTFGRLLAGSITCTFFIYVFVNIGMVSGLLPVVGVPLPLVSHGGTSVVTLMMGFGILMAIATERRKLNIS